MRDRKSRRRSNQRERVQLNRRPFKTLWTNLKVALPNNHQFCHETQKLKNKERIKSQDFLMILSEDTKIISRKRSRLTRNCHLKNSKTKNKTQRSVLYRGNQFQKRNSKKEKMSKSRDLGLLWRVNRKRRKLNSKS